MSKTTVNPVRLTLAANLKRLMESTKYKTQAALAAKAGVSQSHISYILHPESHTMAVTINTVEQVASVFGMEAWQLLVDIGTLSSAVESTVLNLVKNPPNASVSALKSIPMSQPKTNRGASVHAAKDIEEPFDSQAVGHERKHR